MKILSGALIVLCVAGCGSGGSPPGTDIAQKAVGSQAPTEAQNETMVMAIDTPVTAQLGDGSDENSTSAVNFTHPGCDTYASTKWVDFEQTVKSGHPDSLKIIDSASKLADIDTDVQKNTPSGIDLVEGLNVFPEQILPKEISAKTRLGKTPMVMIRYGQAVLADPETTIVNVVSRKRIIGSFVGEGLAHQPDKKSCGQSILSEMQYGAAISMSIRLEFKSADDKKAFKSSFGEGAPFLEDQDTSSDSMVTKFLIAHNVSIQILVGQIGGDHNITDQILDNSGCSIQNLPACRKARVDLFKFFFNYELSTPKDPKNLGGWAYVGYKTQAI